MVGGQTCPAFWLSQFRLKTVTELLFAVRGSWRPWQHSGVVPLPGRANPLLDFPENVNGLDVAPFPRRETGSYFVETLSSPNDLGTNMIPGNVNDSVAVDVQTDWTPLHTYSPRSRPHVAGHFCPLPGAYLSPPTPSP